MQNLAAAGYWNDYYRSARYPQVIDSFLDYRPDIEYGIDVNRKLYWYFKFISEYHGIRLLL
jgi:hypothetical protein